MWRTPFGDQPRTALMQHTLVGKAGRAQSATPPPFWSNRFGSVRKQPRHPLLPPPPPPPLPPPPSENAREESLHSYPFSRKETLTIVNHGCGLFCCFPVLLLCYLYLQPINITPPCHFFSLSFPQLLFFLLIFTIIASSFSNP